MAVVAGWSPLSGPKVPAEATHRSSLTSPTRSLGPRVPIPPTRDDGFFQPECCAPSAGSCHGSCADKLAVNLASGSLLYRYSIPEHTLPIDLWYESDQAGEDALGGRGWRSGFDRKIEQSASVVTVTCSDGCQVPYTKDGSTGTYYPSPGVDNLLEQDASEHLCLYRNRAQRPSVPLRPFFRRPTDPHRRSGWTSVDVFVLWVESVLGGEPPRPQSHAALQHRQGDGV